VADRVTLLSHRFTREIVSSLAEARIPVKLPSGTRAGIH